MTTAQNGNTVKIHYTGKLDDGIMFDSSVDREPLEFTIGAGQVIAGFEEGVIGMSLEESKTIRIPANKAYGPHRKEMLGFVDQCQFPPKLKPEIGRQNDYLKEKN